MEYNSYFASEDAAVVFALQETDGIGWKTIHKLASLQMPLIEALRMPTPKLLAAGIPAKQARVIQSIRIEETIEVRLPVYMENHVHIITPFDNDYPTLLKEISTPPWVLYVLGDKNRLKYPSFAVVGTRHPTYYGKQAAEKLSRELSNTGLTIISGLARGIDKIAHTGALQGRGSTIAVLGTGLDQIYPREHRALFQSIAEKGCIVTESPWGTPFHPGLFPLRNRIIAGLSLGTLVVEAAERSGSLITADYALEYSRDVFAVPGPIFSKQSQGTLKMIQQGAKLVTCCSDILEEYEHRVSLHSMEASDEGALQDEAELTEDERFIIRLFEGTESFTFDQLLEKSKFTFGHLHSVLLHLTLKTQIIQLPGSSYMRNMDS
ncbi:DNA-processing protein DprA [Marinicrinis lubricantis]|uniref:DNA-processing protein DprA n=2 Tax=Marinicrinis lubricantis TaxID=2086470 RepID=A0ABW1IMG5_9BACL